MQDLDRAELGPAPNRIRAESVAHQFLMATLKDPMSAVIQYLDIGKSWYRTSGFAAPKFAWSLGVSVNAKNSYGGYTGAQMYWFYFIGENWVATGAPTQVWNGTRYETAILIAESGGGGWTWEQAGLNKK